jgi:hypothetical protein
METERGAYPGLLGKPWSRATSTVQAAADASPETKAAVPGKTGLNRAGAYVTEALDKARQKIEGYRASGIEQMSHDVFASARNRPKTAFLIAAGVCSVGCC